MPARNPQHIDLNNEEFQNALKLITNTRRSVFLTGKAGTGKSTFLRHICATTKKKYVVLAPTGIAAVNVGGQTLHSFFKIPFKPLLPDDPDFSVHRIRNTLRYPKNKIKLIKELELIIIDEISMVRVDVIDFVDRVLRIFSGNMREPFGGKQLLLVGDVFQLDPVVTADTRMILRRYYHDFYFFNARVFGELGLIPIELQKIYRQTDNAFISLLDRVRVNGQTAADMQLLNSRCRPDYRSEGDTFEITLATRRDTVDAINDEHIAALKTEERTYVGQIEGLFADKDLPTALQLLLKVDAQIIFIRNDSEGRWVNGSIGRVTALSDDAITVTLENGEDYVVEAETWENIQYTYNEKKRVVEENVLGSFRQLPVKPAWALTVHKSQGLTFSRVVLDFAGGAFTGGQTYVALSRCTSLEGITLLKPLHERDIIVSPAVVSFSRQFNNNNSINEALRHARADVLYKAAANCLDAMLIRQAVERFSEAMALRPMLDNPAVRRLIATKLCGVYALKKQIHALEQVCDAQQQMLRNLAREYSAMGREVLESRGGNLLEETTVDYGNRSTPAFDEVALAAAVANFNKALQICPDCVEAMTGHARLQLLLDDDQMAEQWVDKALAVDADCYDAYLVQAAIHSRRDDDAATIRSLKRAVRVSPRSAEPHRLLAGIYRRIGLDDLADIHQQKVRALEEESQRPRRAQHQ